MSWMSGSPTTKRRAEPVATATLSARRTSAPPGVVTTPSRAIASCIARRSGGGPQPVVAVEPARDGVAREIDDVAASAIELLDDGMEHPPDVRGQLLGAALGTELLGEGLGQWRETGDVGEQGRTANPIGHLDLGREGTPAIAGDVCLGLVAGERDRAGGHRRCPLSRLTRASDAAARLQSLGCPDPPRLVPPRPWQPVACSDDERRAATGRLRSATSRRPRAPRPSWPPTGGPTSMPPAARSSSTSATAARRSPPPWPTRRAASPTRTGARSRPNHSRRTRPRSGRSCRWTTRPSIRSAAARRRSRRPSSSPARTTWPAARPSR